MVLQEDCKYIYRVISCYFEHFYKWLFNILIWLKDTYCNWVVWVVTTYQPHQVEGNNYPLKISEILFSCQYCTCEKLLAC